MSRKSVRSSLPRVLHELAGSLERLGDRHDPHTVYCDFVEMGACALSNKFDLAQYDKREKRYLEIIHKYKRLEDRLVFPEMLAQLAVALDVTGEDVLSRVTEAIGMCDYRKGHFWTPWTVSYMMAQMVLGGPTEAASHKEAIKDHGFITVAEPACGPGGMAMAAARAFEEAGFDPKTQLHIMAVDTTAWCAHSAYIQLALAGVPACVVIGNSLFWTFTEFWYTPAHVMGGFSPRLRKRGIDLTNAAWWAKLDLPERVGFLNENGLHVKGFDADKPTREVLDRKAQADRDTAAAAALAAALPDPLPTEEETA